MNLLKTKKKIFAIVSILILCMGGIMLSVSQASAETSQQKLDKLKALEKQAKNNLSAAMAAVQQKAKEVEALEVKLRAKQSDVNKLEADIKLMEDKIKSHSDNLNLRLRNMYKNGSIGYLEIILSSESFSDFMANIDMIKRIYQSDADTLENLKTQKTELDTKKTQLKSEAAALSEQKSKVESEKKDLEKQQDIIKSQIDQLEAQQDALALQIIKENSTKPINPAVPPAPTGNGMFIWPTRSRIITSPYGKRTDPIRGITKFHAGVDIGGNTGDPVWAAADGTVIFAATDISGSNTVIINHGNGYFTSYYHNSRLAVSAGQAVKQGQVVAYVGSTGYSTGPHLHFGVAYGSSGQYINPMQFF